MVIIVFPKYLHTIFALQSKNLALNQKKTSLEDNPQYLELLDRVGEIFRRHGLRSVTMDDVAGKLGISKKTLYKHFDNKRDLIEKSIIRFLELEKKDLTKIREEAENAVEEMLLMGEYANKHLAELNPAAVYDARKYFPRSWVHLENYRHEFIYECILDNLERGKETGLYRDDINPDIIARMYTARMDMFFDPLIFPPGKYSLILIYQSFMDCHIRGIASSDGVAYLERHLKSANA
ncbi:MAG: AcrR family transcriptional regulator [Limisphaerales bacterium]